MDRIQSAPKGPSVQSVIDGKGKARVQDILAVRSGGPSVEEARAAMLAAGEAPVGSPNEARPVSQKDPELQTRWDKGYAKRQSSTTVKADYTPRPKESRPTISNADDSEFNVKISVSDGQVIDFVSLNRITMIREIKKFQAKLQTANNKLPVSQRLSAKIEWTPLNPGQNDNPNPTVLQVEPSTEAQRTDDDTSRGDGGSVASEPEIERTETNKFVSEIFREGGEWVAKIKYKNGAGTEEFRASTRRALDMELLKGKANATLKIREVLRRDTFHDDLDKVYDIPGYSQEAFDALSADTQILVIDTIASKSALTFREEVPEFYGTADNTDKLMSFLHKRNLPITVKNLRYAFEELADDLEQRPKKVSEKTESAVPPKTAVVEDSTPTPVATPAASAAPSAPALSAEVRTRGSFGFKPGFTSSVSELEESESGKKSTEPSEQELRTMPLEELQKMVRKGYKQARF